MRIKDLPARVTTAKADWLPGTHWLGFTPNLVFDCRIPIDEIARFFRRDNFDSSGLLTRCRLQDLDLGYDRRTLAFQRSEPRHEFGNSDVRSFMTPSITEKATGKVAF
jgi:hypothetical protein